MAMLVPITGGSAFLLLIVALVWLWMRRRRNNPGANTPWFAGAPQMMTPQPVMQGGWVDQSAWEAQFMLHNSQPIDQQAIQAAIANSTMTQAAPMYNNTMAPVLPQEAAAQPDAYLTIPMQTNAAPSNGYSQQMMSAAAPSNGYNQQMTMGAPPPNGYGQVMTPAGPDPQLESAYVYEDQAPAQQYVYENHQPAPEAEDPFLEAMMRQAQMGIFASPNKAPENAPA